MVSERKEIFHSRMCGLVLSHHISSACCTVVLSFSEQSEIVKFLRHLAFYHRGREREGEVALCFSCLRQVFSPNDTVSLRLYMHDDVFVCLAKSCHFCCSAPAMAGLTGQPNEGCGHLAWQGDHGNYRHLVQGPCNTPFFPSPSFRLPLSLSVSTSCFYLFLYSFFLLTIRCVSANDTLEWTPHYIYI